MNKEEFLIFNMLGIPYGVRLSRVREIITYDTKITPLPGSSAWVLGVINLRGEITPVIDFRLKFSNIKQLYDDESIIIALRFEGDRMMAIVVDSIEDIEYIDMNETQRSPDIGSTIDPRYLEGLVKSGNNMVSLLNIDEILSLKEI
jgi:purine-binding chemotaxis protein CheW